MATTLQALRRAIGGLTGDQLLLTATSNGTTTSLVDSLTLAVENNSLVGRQGIFASGTAANTGSIVRITANDKSATSVTFPAVSANTATGDVLELYSKDGQGPTVAQMHAAINRCITFVSGGVLTEVVADAVTFDRDDPELTIPATWRRLTAIEWRDPSATPAVWLPIPEADWRPTVDRVALTVRLDGLARERADTYEVRLRGFTPAGQLSADSDTTLVDAEWIIHEAASQLLLAQATAERIDQRRAADWRATAQFYKTLANTYRVKVPTTLRGATGIVLDGTA